MDPNHNNLNQGLTHLKTHSHRGSLIPLRRRKLPAVCLGGKKPRRGHFFVKLVRRARLRWLKIKNVCTLKKLTQYYRCLIREIIEASAAMETLQFDPTSGVPVVGMSSNSHYTKAVYGPCSNTPCPASPFVKQ